MYKFFIIFFFSSLLLNASSNPKPYATLGDKIYDNAKNIKKLENLGDYYLYLDDIKKYLQEVKATKKLGYMLNDNSTLQSKKDYLEKLRELSKDNDYFMRMAETSFKSSIKNNDSLLFSQVINSNLIDTKKYKKEILDYYFTHSKDINSSGLIQKYLDEDKALQEAREKMHKKYKTKKMLEAEKIKRLREEDKRKHMELEERLNKVLEKKKKEIRKEQKMELIKSI